MNSLPIRFLTDEDSLIFGPLNVALGKLARSGLPIAEGIVTILPDGEPKLEIAIKKIKVSGSAFYDPSLEDVKIEVTSGKPHPNDLKKIDELVREANKKLFMSHVYEWILDKEVKLVKVLPYTPSVIPANAGIQLTENIYGSLIKSGMTKEGDRPKSTVKVFLDLSSGLVVEKQVDGVYISSEKILDWEELVFKLVEITSTFPEKPVLMKLADMSEGMGKVRGSLRLIHQKSLLDSLCEAVLFVRNKHNNGHRNLHLVIPFVRGAGELQQIQRELAVRKLIRENNLQIWLELAVPENIINLEEYLINGVDGVVLNLDELSSHFNGFDYKEDEMAFYKNEVSGLLKFLEDGVKLLHRSKAPFLAVGSLALNPMVLEFLVEKGVYGIVVERYETHSMVDLLHQAEKRMILRKAQ